MGGSFGMDHSEWIIENESGSQSISSIHSEEHHQLESIIEWR